MNFAEITPVLVAIVFGITGALGLAYTIYYGRKGLKSKLLVYENSISIPLAQAFSPEDDYQLSVLFQRRGSTEEKIKSVYTTFLKFANLGKEPIRGADIAPANPVKVKIQGTRTLDIQIAGITRKVNNVSIINQVIGENEASAELYFDFLDYKDGALVKILTAGDEGQISLSGDIIGMPEGIKNVEETSDNRSEGSISGWSAIAVFIAALALTASIHYSVTGSWKNVWLVFIFLPILILVSLIAFAISKAWPGRKLSFPESLDLPSWCRRFVLYPRALMREQLMQMRLEDKPNGRSPKPSEDAKSK